MRLAVPIPIDLPLRITCYVADAQAASMMERALEAPGSAWGPEVLRDAEYNLCVVQLVTLCNL